jgi:hypothetical protein
VSDQTYTQLKQFIERRQQFNGLKKVTIHLNAVSFEDGSLWTGGDYFRPDPNNPKSLIRSEN